MKEESIKETKEKVWKIMNGLRGVYLRNFTWLWYDIKYM